MSVKVKVETHSSIDKSFQIEVGGVWSAKVDYDDVNHSEVDAATEYIQEIISEHWDKARFKKLHAQMLEDEWNTNKYDLQSDYESFEDYMSQHGAPIKK